MNPRQFSSPLSLAHHSLSFLQIYFVIKANLYVKQTKAVKVFHLSHAYIYLYRFYTSQLKLINDEFDTSLRLTRKHSAFTKTSRVKTKKSFATRTIDSFPHCHMNERPKMTMNQVYVRQLKENGWIGYSTDR